MNIHQIRIFQRLVLISFSFFLCSSAVFAFSQENGRRVRGVFSPGPELSRSPRIKLQWREMDVKNRDELRAEGIPDAMSGLSAVSPAGREYLIVQFNGPITDEQRNGLTACGARIYEYIPDFAFLVGIGRNRKTSLESIPGYLGSLPYLAKFKCSSFVKKKPVGETEGKDITQILLRFGTEPLDVQIIAFKGEDAKTLISVLTGLGVTVHECSRPGRSKLK
jgi:hypothetical protein